MTLLFKTKWIEQSSASEGKIQTSKHFLAIKDLDPGHKHFSRYMYHKCVDCIPCTHTLPATYTILVPSSQNGNRTPDPVSMFSVVSDLERSPASQTEY